MYLVKVLQINTVCGTGSTGRIAVDLHNVLKEQGHECVIAYGRGKAPAGVSTIKIGSDLSVNIHGVLSRITDKHGLYSTMATNRLIKEIRDYAPDIIHLHNIHGYYINIEILFNYLNSANKPVVWTLHDCWSFTGHCAFFDYVNCSKWKSLCENCPQKSSYPASLLLDNSKSNYVKKRELFNSVNNMTIVTPSKWLAGLVKQSFLEKYPVKVINNGIDLNMFKPTFSNIGQKYSLEDKFVVLGVASVWDRRKGLSDFIELSKILDKRYKIILVGLSSKQLNDIPHNIIGITKTNNVKELAEIYTLADVFVNPTQEDNFPTTNIEALACGTPVITYNTGGSVESLDANCGYVIEKGNIQQLKNAIENIGSKEAYTKYCIEKGKSYDKRERFGEYIELYRSVLELKH